MFKVLVLVTSVFFSFSALAETIQLPVPPQMTCSVKELYGESGSETLDTVLITYSRTVPMLGSSNAHYFDVESLEGDYESEFTFGYRSRAVTYFIDDSLQPDYFNELCGNYTELLTNVFYFGSGDAGPVSCLVCW